MIVASTSTVYGGGYLEYLLPELSKLFENASSLLFVPYARPGGMSHDDYTQIVRSAFQALSIEVRGIHEFDNARDAVKKAEALFVGGGNTFVLLNRLYEEDLLPVMRKAVRRGTPYLGTSAGSNITGPNVMTTNDMPIVDPPSLAALDLLPFNLNPHYLDPDPDSKHQGETRETRIAEFHAYNDEIVVGLREGSWIEVREDQMLLKGSLSARIFKPGFQAYELETGQDLRPLAGQQ
jgi:dipeptidase E